MMTIKQIKTKGSQHWNGLLHEDLNNSLTLSKTLSVLVKEERVEAFESSRFPSISALVLLHLLHQFLQQV